VKYCPGRWRPKAAGRRTCGNRLRIQTQTTRDRADFSIGFSGGVLEAWIWASGDHGQYPAVIDGADGLRRERHRVTAATKRLEANVCFENGCDELWWKEGLACMDLARCEARYDDVSGQPTTSHPPKTKTKSKGRQRKGKSELHTRLLATTSIVKRQRGEVNVQGTD
jgi:hypothetical protein